MAAVERGPAAGTTTIWHDLECGGYDHDLPVWRELAAAHGGPILDIGAGTGRVTRELAAAGHTVCAVDHDAELVGELRRRTRGLPVTGEVADARTLALHRRFALCVVPMQTIQLFGGRDGRIAFLTAARGHLLPGGVLAAAIAEDLDLFDIADGALGPLPDVTERGGVVYSSSPTAVRERDDGYVLERRREIVGPRGELDTERDVIHLDRVSALELEEEGRAAGLSPVRRLQITETAEYTGSTVVILGG